MNLNKLLPKWLRDLLDATIKSSKKCKPIVKHHRKIGRNEQCRCGCGIKYKHHLWSADVKNGIR